MKKFNLSLVLILVSSLFSSVTCEAQFIEKLQKRAEERAKKRVEQKIENRVDKAVDKTVDTPENAIQQSRKQSEQNNQNTNPAIDVTALLNTSENIKLPDSYEFNQKVTYVMKDTSSKQETQMTYWFSNDSEIFAVETSSYQNALIVYDLKQDAMLMFSEKEKKVQVVPFGMFGAIYDNASDDNDDNFTFKKTSETKKISGYNCQKYMMNSDSIEGEFWFTKDVNIKITDFSKAFLSMGKTSNQTIPEINPSEYGFMIEMKAKDKSTNQITQMTVKEISKVSKKIITSQFKK